MLGISFGEMQLVIQILAIVIMYVVVILCVGMNFKDDSVFAKTVYITRKIASLLPTNIERRYKRICLVITYLNESLAAFVSIMSAILLVDTCIFDDFKHRCINMSFIILFLYLLIRVLLSINANKIKNRYKNYVFNKHGLDLKIEFSTHSINKFSSILTHIDLQMQAIYKLCSDDKLKRLSIHDLVHSYMKATVSDNKYQDAVVYANRILTDMAFVRELNKRLNSGKPIDSDLQAVLDKLRSKLVIIDSKLTELERTLNRLLNEQVLVNGDVNEMTFEQRVKYYKSDL